MPMKFCGFGAHPLEPMPPRSCPPAANFPVPSASTIQYHALPIQAYESHSPAPHAEIGRVPLPKTMFPALCPHHRCFPLRRHSRSRPPGSRCRFCPEAPRLSHRRPSPLTFQPTKQSRGAQGPLPECSPPVGHPGYTVGRCRRLFRCPQAHHPPPTGYP